MGHEHVGQCGSETVDATQIPITRIARVAQSSFRTHVPIGGGSHGIQRASG